MDGGWSNWKVGSCSVTCGGGVKEKFRICNNPAPSCGGKECIGLKVDTEDCNDFLCNGQYMHIRRHWGVHTCTHACTHTILC